MDLREIEKEAFTSWWEVSRLNIESHDIEFCFKVFATGYRLGYLQKSEETRGKE